MSTSIAVISLAGELEISRRDEIANALVFNGNESSILLDFSGVTYADSSALAELLRFRDEASKRDIPIAIVTGSRQFERLITYAGLSHAFRIFNNRAEALLDLTRAAKE